MATEGGGGASTGELDCGKVDELAIPCKLPVNEASFFIYIGSTIHLKSFFKIFRNVLAQYLCYIQ